MRAASSAAALITCIWRTEPPTSGWDDLASVRRAFSTSSTVDPGGRPSTANGSTGAAPDLTCRLRLATSRPYPGPEEPPQARWLNESRISTYACRTQRAGAIPPRRKRGRTNNMQKTRVRRAGALLVGLALVAAACGDDDDDAPAAATTEAAPDETDAPATTEAP